MNRKPLVSICVPIYGVEPYIERCARSLFEQTYDNIEYVFVNDCTKDRSVELLRRVASSYEERAGQIRIISHEKNKGLAAARATAIRNSKGRFLLHVDSDDYLEETAVEKLVKKQNQTQADIVLCDYDEIRKDAVISRRRDYCACRETYLKNLLSFVYEHFVWGVLIDAKIQRERDICPKEGVNIGEDFLVLPLLVYYASRVVKCDEVLYHYNRQNETSLTVTFANNQLSRDFMSLDELERCFQDKPRKYQDCINYAKVLYVLVHFRKVWGDSNRAAEFVNAYNRIDVRYKRSRCLPARVRSIRMLVYLRYFKIGVQLKRMKGMCMNLLYKFFVNGAAIAVG